MGAGAHGESVRGTEDTSPNTNTDRGATGSSRRGRKRSPYIIFSDASNNNKIQPGVLAAASALNSPYSVLPRWPGALFLHSTEDTALN